MGTDIHTMAEVKVNDYRKPLDRTNPNTGYEQKWKAVTEPVFENDYFREDEPIGLRNVPYTSTPYSGRNYDLFAVLADVRNGRGFAGVATGDAVQVIAEPKGVPDDASKKWLRYVERWGMDLHSISYFTLAELEAAMPLLKQHQRKTGVISEREYLRIQRDGGTPQSWSGGVGGGGVRVVSVDEYEAGIRAEGESPDDVVEIPEPGQKVPFIDNRKTYIQYAWETTLESATGWFIEHTIEGLRRIAPRIGPMTWDDRRRIMAENDGEFVDPRPYDADAVRLVFGFDN